MKTTKNPVRRLLASLMLQKKPIAKLHADFRRSNPLLHREESLNKIFMVRYRMQNL